MFVNSLMVFFVCVFFSGLYVLVAYVACLVFVTLRLCGLCVAFVACVTFEACVAFVTFEV